MQAADALSLLDWKRRVQDLYRDVRTSSDPSVAWALWKSTRDELFAEHPQSPLPPDARAGFSGLDYFPYDPAWRIEGSVEGAEPIAIDVAASDVGTYRFLRIGTVSFVLAGAESSLDLFWLGAYGGGLFLPFRDATSGRSTYGAGRYLLDTVKGADLGGSESSLVLDFNFAYNPSCSYDERWSCPLAPPGNRLEIEVEAGERYGARALRRAPE